MKLIQGDCLEEMKKIKTGSVDMVLTDPPYGTTACKWDSIIPLEPMWEQLKRVIKPNGAIVMFGSEPFSSSLRVSNLGYYKYDIVWKKEKPTNFFQLKRRIGKVTENIMLFYEGQCTYNPQMVKAKKLVTNSPKGSHKSIVAGNSGSKVTAYKDTGYRYPVDVLEVNREKLGSNIHPTQKPVALMEYLIRTYTNEGETVLDFAMGSGTTGVAAKNLNRDFIGIELDESYYNIAKERIESA
jgi:site-specific DNA-methyltransferase (adenine-specific)